MLVVPWEGAPDQLPVFYHAVLTSKREQTFGVGLDVLKRSSTFSGKKSAPQIKSWLHV